MAIKTQVNAVLSKKMDRQGFIKHLAIAAVAISGVGTAMRLLASDDKQKSQNVGYGSSVYGGSKNS